MQIMFASVHTSRTRGSDVKVLFWVKHASPQIVPCSYADFIRGRLRVNRF